jgi:Flp pilus assembly protein protease CpaA
VGCAAAGCADRVCALSGVSRAGTGFPGAGPGLGDVKLAGVLGLLLGWLGWGQAIVSIFATFITGAVIALSLLLMGRVSRSSHMACGPS